MGLPRLLLLSLTMFLSTLAIGNLPLSLSATLSPLRIRQISVYGVGLLVGAALTIIIPEGVDAVYESTSGGGEKGEGEHGHGHGHEEKGGLVGLALVSGFMLMFLIDQLQAGHHHHQHTSRTLSRRKPSHASAQPLLTRASSFSLASNHSLTRHSGSLDHSQIHTPDLEQADQLDAYDSQPEDYFPGTVGNGATNGNGSKIGRSGSPLGAGTGNGVGGANGGVTAGHSSKSLSTTIGLIAHSLADGISLGASSALVPSAVTTAAATATSPENTSLDLIVFLAIMIHKAPAAFGMVAVLMSEGLSKSRIRQALLGFSAAAPVGALGTWGLLQLLVGGGDGGGEGQRERVEWWTGMALLFSGGTFLFVSTHVMQESAPHDSAPPGPGEPSPVEVGRGMKTALMVAGMISPMVLTKIVGHGH